MIKKTSVKYGVIFTAAGYLLWSLISSFLFGLPILRVLLYTALLILGIAIPGIAVFKLLKIKETPLGALVMSAAFGMGCLVVLYLVLTAFDLLFYHSFEGLIALGVISGIILIIKRKQPFSSKEDTGELSSALILSTISVFVTVFFYSAAIVNPGLSGIRAFENDPLFASSVTAAASRGWPFICLQVAGIRMDYHFVFYAIFGLLKNASGISAFETVTKLSLPVVTPFLISAFWLLFNKVYNDRRAILMGMIFGLMFPCSYAFFYYTYQDLLGFPLSLAYFAVAYYCYLRYRDDHSVITCTISSVFVILSLLAKGPVGCMVLFGIGIVMIIDFFKKPTLKTFICGLIYLVPFIAVYFIVYGSAAGDSLSLSLGYSAIRMGLGKYIYPAMQNNLGRWICIIVYALTFVPLTTIGLFVSIRNLVKNKKSTPTDIFIISTIILGTIIMVTLKQDGSSEWYFLFCMIPQAAMAICNYIVEHKNNGAKALPVILTVLLTVGAFCWSGPYAWDGISTAVKYSRFTDHSVSFVDETVELIQTNKRDKATSPDEYDALIWLRDNTPINSVIADSRYLYNAFYAGGSAFSERPFYIQGNNYVTIPESLRIERDGNLRYFYILEEEGFMSLLFQKGVDYILVDDFYNPDYRPENPNATLVYENETMRVYELHA